MQATSDWLQQVKHNGALDWLLHVKPSGAHTLISTCVHKLDGVFAQGQTRCITPACVSNRVSIAVHTTDAIAVLCQQTVAAMATPAHSANAQSEQQTPGPYTFTSSAWCTSA